MLRWSGWALAADPVKEKPLFQKIDHIGTLIDHQHWDQATVEINSLIKLYQKEKWKLQLSGDKLKYEQILDKLKVAMKEKDKTEIKLTLVTIRIIIKAIYTI